MIESEEKKKRLTEEVTRWCEHTKVMPYLRDYDIPHLVGSILEEFYCVHLCCGHLVSSHEDGRMLMVKFLDFIVWHIAFKECAEKYKKELNAWEVKE